MLHAALHIFPVCHGEPLEGGEGLRDKGIHAEGQGSLAALLLHAVLQAVRQVNDGFNIFLLLKRQSQHQIQLELLNACGKAQAHRPENILLLYALVDDPAHAPAAGLRRDGQGLQPAPGQGVHQFLRHGIRPEGGH